MSVSNILIAIAVISGLWSVVSSISIAAALQNRGIKVSYLFLRVMIFKYIGQYRKVTRDETGRTGPWFYAFLISVNLALVTAVVGLVLKAT